MARKFLVSVDLNKNELLNARVQNLGSAPSSPVTGQIYYDTGTNILYFYNGTEFIPASGSLEVIQDAINTTIVAGTGLDKTYDDSAGTFTLDIDSTVATLTGTQTLTNKTLTSPVLGGTTTTASGNLVVKPATNILEVQGDGASVVGQLQLNCHVNSHGQKIASQPHSQNATNTLKLPGGTAIGNADAVLVSDTGTQTLTNKTLTSPVVTGLDATSSAKGLASFDATDFTVTSGNVVLNAERVQDIVGGMVSANTESGISVTYDDPNGKLDFDVNDFSITLTGDVTGSGTVTNLGNVSFAATIQPDSVALGTDTTGAYIATVAGTANEVEVSGSGGETAAITIGLPNDVTITNNLTVGGNLNVTGTINSVNTTQVNIVDNKINLNTDFTGTPTVDAGVRVERGTSADTEILWREAAGSYQAATTWGLTNDGTNYHSIARKWSSNITTTEVSPFTFAATHNLGTRDVSVAVYSNSAPYGEVEVDVDHTSTSVVTLTFAAAPTAGAYRVVITG